METIVNLPQEQQNIITAYCQYLYDDGKAARTVQSYVSDVSNFLTHVTQTDPKPLSNLTRQDVTAFRNYMVKQGFQPATVNKAINSLSCFTQYLKEQGILPDNLRIVEPKKDRVKVAAGSEREVSVLNEQQVNALLALANNPVRMGLRNRLIIHLLLYTGCRVSELVNIRVRDIDFLLNTLTVRGKGEKLREVPIKESLIEITKEYLKKDRAENKFSDSEYLLVSQRAKKMHRDAVNTLLEKLAKDLNIHLHPHQFRHTFCSRLVQKGVPLTTVAKLAGHAGVETTAKFYISTSRQDKLAAVNLL